MHNLNLPACLPACLPFLAALERAHTAQATAMLSCLEESERVRLQQLSVACDSPMGPLAGARGHRSEFTDDSSAGGGAAFEDALEFSESGSFASCPTPHGSSTSGGGGGGFSGGDGAASVFHSVENSPEKQQLGSGASSGSSSRQRQQQHSPAGGSGGGSGGGGKPKHTPPRKPASRS